MKTLKNINLKVKRSERTEKIQKIGKSLSIISFLFLVVFLILYTISFSLLSYFTLRFKSTQDKVTELTQNINQKRDIEAIMVASSHKLSAIDKILAAELSYVPILTDILSLSQSNLQFNILSITPEGEVAVDLIASSAASLDTFSDALLAKDEIENKYKSIKAKNIAKNKDNTYGMSIMFNLNQKEFNEKN